MKPFSSDKSNQRISINLQIQVKIHFVLITVNNEQKYE